MRGALMRAAYDALAAMQLTARRVSVALSELVLALHNEDIERYALDRHYDERVTAYLTNYGDGLYPFEARAVDEFFPPPGARILVPACGSGREMLALKTKGYVVEGFDPIERYVEIARRVTNAPVAVDTLQSWAARVSASRYDAVLVGWGAWSHILLHGHRMAILRALRVACPTGPVLLSFHSAESVYDPVESTLPPQPLHPEPARRRERWPRKILRERLLSQEPLERGTGFHDGRFFHYCSEAELREEAASAGYRVAYFERNAARFPNAVLTPQP